MAETRRGAVFAVVLIGIIVIAAFVFVWLRGNFSANHSAPATISPAAPFDYNMSVYPANGTVQQGKNVTANLDITYLQRSIQNVTLTANGGPNGTTFMFSTQTGTLSVNDSFVGTVLIYVPESAIAGTYRVNITSTAATGKTYSDQYELTVQNVEIQVSGKIYVDSSNNTFPTQIQFLSHASTNPAPSTSAPVRLNVGVLFSGVETIGDFTVSIANQQMYTVIIKWESISDD